MWIMPQKNICGNFTRFVILCTVSLCSVLVACEADEFFKVKEMSPGYTGKFSWGLSSVQKPLKDFPQIRAALSQYPEDHKVQVIRRIIPGGAGEAEGLLSGDIILENSPYSTVTSRPGEKVSMKVWRAKEGKLCDMTIILPQYYQIKYSPYHKPAAADEFEKELPPDWESYAHLLRSDAVRSNLDDLRQRLTDIDSLTDAYRLPVFRYLIRNPFRIEQVSRGWADKTAAVENWQELLPLSKYMLDFAEPEHADRVETWKKAHPAPAPDASAEEIAAYYVKILQRCDELHKKAWAKITPEEIDFVRKYRHDAFDSICKYHMLSYEPQLDKTHNTLKIFEILNRIEQNELFAQAETAALLYNRQLIDRLKKIYGSQQGILLYKKTPFGDIIISGSGDDYHRQDAAIIIDLGGNDIYLNNQATPFGNNVCTSVFIDCSGNDYYSSTDKTGQGCGDMGVGMLIDLEGNDTYTGIEMVQGSAFGGIGILYDGKGNDTYRAIRMSQAAAFFGAGLLIDHAGADNYTLQHFGQALGSVRGIGILQDHSGDDLYICKGNQQTTYNTRGHFDGWGQGIGFGVRPFASGGIGILQDKSGVDRYDGGTFTQGGGYYYSYGICNDRGDESDFYMGTRYSNGFAAHQALGAFIEQGGNDVYRTLHCVSLGISWDETVVLFVDDQGDDYYHSGEGTSYSAAYQNGICFFFDRNGNDTYHAIPPVPVSYNNYHLGTSLAVFVDSGSGNDKYLERQNNSVKAQSGDGIFIDK